MTIRNILDYLDEIEVEYKFFGNEIIVIKNFCPLKELKDYAITWVRSLSNEVEEKLNNYPTILAFIDDKEDNICLKHNYIQVKNPHRVFFKVIEKFFYKSPIIHESRSSIIESKNIGKNLRIGEFSYIGPNVRIGDNCIIGHNVSIEEKVEIGDDVIIESGVRIGTWGFGNYLNDDKTCTLIPHLGGVKIGKHVFIGANTIVARGTLSDTIIRDHVKIDALCGICHNSEIHERVIITGGAGVAGSAVVKKDSWLAPGCIINSSKIVGENCLIGINSVVSHDVPDNMYAFGIPAKVICENNKYKI